MVLLSGGLDSATVLAAAKDDGFVPYPISFRYGQRHVIELAAAYRVAGAAGAISFVVDIDLRPFGSALTSLDAEIPKDRNLGDMTIPVTYVPARNTIFLAYALAYAETIGSTDIYLGVNALDYSGYPDCRPEYIHAFERMGRLATKAGVEGARLRLHTPLIQLSKAEVIRLGVSLGVDYGLTHSCYDPVGDRPCGACDACLLRAKGFAEVGMADPILSA